MFCLCLCLVCFLQPWKADLLALLYVMFSCVFFTFPYGVLGQVWYLILSIPDICLLLFTLLSQIAAFPGHTQLFLALFFKSSDPLRL